MKFKCGDLILIRLNKLDDIVRDFCNERLWDKGNIVKEVAENRTPLKVVDCDDGREVTVIHCGVELVLYVGEIEKYQSTLRRF